VAACPTHDPGGPTGHVARPHPDKTSVEVHDYADTRVGVVARAHRKRLAAYATLGFAEPADC
jgi:hypothetical protein